MSVETIPTLDEIKAACDANYAQIVSALDRLENPFSDEKDEGGWSVKQLLSHLIGALYRVPIHASFYLASPLDAVPKIPFDAHNDYWINEWEHATTATFRAALDVAYHGNLAFLATLDPADFSRRGNTPFGEWTLGTMLQISYAGHPLHHHGAQLEAFLSVVN